MSNGPTAANSEGASDRFGGVIEDSQSRKGSFESPSRLLACLDKGMRGLAGLCDAALVLTMGLLVFTTGAGVVSRYLEGSPLPWTDEVSSYLFVCLTFIGAASNMWRQSHPHIDLLTSRVGSRAGRILRAVGAGALLSVLAVLIKYGYNSTLQTQTISMISVPLSQAWA